MNKVGIALSLVFVLITIILAYIFGATMDLLEVIAVSILTYCTFLVGAASLAALYRKFNAQRT